MWIIGIDGGGTKCEAGLFNPEGKLVATARSGPANVFANFEGAIAAIEQACEQVILSANSQNQLNVNQVLRKSDCFLSLGCAGGSIDSAKEKFHQWQHLYAGASLTTDVNVSCLAANNAKPCALLVIGTGSCLAVYENHKIKQVGGHGFLLGDIASGAWLGKKAVSWYLQVLETPNADIPLQNALAEQLGDNISDIIEQYGQASSGKFGALVPLILQVKAKSPTVESWLQEGTKYSSELLHQHTSPNTAIYLTGGLAVVYKPLIEAKIKRQILIPKDNAVCGAYYAGKQYLMNTHRNYQV